jgi:hypothetical protein
MADSLSKKIEAQLQRYLQGEDSLDEFEAWLVPETWDISPQSDRSAHDLATVITLRIAEFTNGDWTEEELREALTQLRRPDLSPLVLSEVEFLYSGGKEDQSLLGTQTHLAKFSVVGTGRSKVAA